MKELPSFWRPTTEAQLLSAATAGLLNEGTPHRELKQQLDSSPSANKELARDLASLAVAGGLLLVGIVDEKARTPGDPTTALHPIPVAGLPERVEQIALTRCDPPLFVRCVAIERSSGSGYLAIHVPPSPQAPHVVEGRYLGRGERTKRNLTDSDVVVLHARREMLDRDAGDALEEYRRRDPWLQTANAQTAAHLYFVADPRPGRDSMLLDFVNRSTKPAASSLASLVRKRANDPPRFGSLWAPDFDTASDFSTRSDRWVHARHRRWAHLGRQYSRVLPHRDRAV